MESQQQPQINQKMIDAFARLGLTSIQTRVYLATLRGCSKATQISKLSNIGSGDVYRALNVLQSRGLMSKKVGTPNTFVPLAFDDALTVLMNRKKTEDKRMEARLKELRLAIEHFETKKSDSPKEPELTWVPPKLFHYKVQEIVRNAQNEVCGIFSAVNLLLIFNGNTGEKDQRLNLRTRIITEKSASSMDFQSFERLSNRQVRYQENPVTVNIFLNDNDEVFLTALPDAKVGFCPNIFSDNPCLAQVIREYFELKWKEASKKP